MIPILYIKYGPNQHRFDLLTTTHTECHQIILINHWVKNVGVYSYYLLILNKLSWMSLQNLNMIKFWKLKKPRTLFGKFCGRFAYFYNFIQFSKAALDQKRFLIKVRAFDKLDKLRPKEWCKIRPGHNCDQFTCYELSEQYQLGTITKFKPEPSQICEVSTFCRDASVNWRTFTSIGTTWCCRSENFNLFKGGLGRSIGTFHCKRPELTNQHKNVLNGTFSYKLFGLWASF